MFTLKYLLNENIFSSTDLRYMWKCVSEALTGLNLSANLIKVRSADFVRLARREVWMCLSSPVGGECKVYRKGTIHYSLSIALL